MKDFTQIKPSLLEENAVRLIGEQWMLVSSGTLCTESDTKQNGVKTWNTMTASWGGMGFLWNKPVAFVFVRPQRYTFEFTEKHDYLSLSFFSPQYRSALEFCGKYSGRNYDKAAKTGLTPVVLPNGSVGFSEARMILECKKSYADFIKGGSFIDNDIVRTSYPAHDFHRMYVCEITAAWIKNAATGTV